MNELNGKKVKGFKFEGNESVFYNLQMDKHIGEVGVIEDYDEMYDNFYVQFKTAGWCYPASEIEKHLVDEPKRGDEAMFSNDGKKWEKGIFAGEIEGAIKPYFSGHSSYKKEFLDKEPFMVTEWKYMKPLPNKTKVTKQQIADKFDIDLDNLEIVD